MLNLPLSMVIEGLVAVLLVVTIGYCILLNSRLKRLRADEEDLRATIAELLTATEIAERAIHALQSCASESEASLGRSVQEADDVSEQLGARTAAAMRLIERLGKLAGVQASAGSAPMAPSRPQAVPQPQAPSQAHAARRLDDAARALEDRLRRIAS